VPYPATLLGVDQPIRLRTRWTDDSPNDPTHRSRLTGIASGDFNLDVT
jgi:hypothetical protein